MRKADIVVVGGGAAGFTAALLSKNMYPDMEVIIIRKEEKALIPCGIPYIFSSLEGNVDRDILPDSPLLKNGVEILVDNVDDVDRANKIVKTSSGEEVKYKKLILATGSLPFKINLPGSNLENVFYVYKNYDYLKRLVEAIKDSDNIVIIGGGFIGCEFADDISKLGKNVAIVELMPHCLSLNFDEEFCVIGEEELRKRGVKIFSGVKATEILGNGKAKAVKLSTGQELPADTVIIAVGARPNVELAKKIGLRIGETGAIAVDGYMRTSDPDIFAVGDCCEKIDFFTQRPAKVMLASVAAAEARIAVANLFNLSVIRQTIPIFSTKIGDVAIGIAGIGENRARSLGFEVVTGYAETVDKHPGSLPSAKKIKLKLVVGRKCQTILGCEIAGGPSTGELANLASILIAKRIPLCELFTMPVGTHPLLTPSPVTYPLSLAAMNAYKKLIS